MNVEDIAHENIARCPWDYTRKSPSGMSTQVVFGSLEVLGRIDTDGVEIGLCYAYDISILEPSQLLEGFGLLECTGWQTGYLGKYLGTIAVYAYVPIVLMTA